MDGQLVEMVPARTVCSKYLFTLQKRYLKAGKKVKIRTFFCATLGHKIIICDCLKH